MRDPFRLPRRFLRDTMVYRTFTTRRGPLHLWAGLLMKDDERCAHLDIHQDAYSAMWLLRGETAYSDDEGEVRAGAGHVVCRLPGRRHSTIPVAGSGLIEFFINIDVTWFRQLAALGAVPDRPCAYLGWDPALAEGCLAFIDRLRLVAEESWPLALAEAQSLLAAFAVGCARGGSPDPRIADACAILADDAPGRLSLAAVARRVGLGGESFRKRFAAATGQSPGAWRIRRRIDTACTRLLSEDLPLGAIAAELGYPDVPTFAKQFRRVIGQPPAAWRRARSGTAVQAAGRHAVLRTDRPGNTRGQQPP